MADRWMAEFVQAHLRPEDSCLDLGCGILSWNFGKPPCGDYLGVDGYQPYLDRIAPHAETARVQLPDGLSLFRDASFDVVLMLDLIEHLDDGPAGELLDHADRIARRVILVVTPDGFHAQDGYNAWRLGHNELQAHRSAWTEDRLGQCGYTLYRRVEVEAGMVMLLSKRQAR